MAAGRDAFDGNGHSPKKKKKKNRREGRGMNGGLVARVLCTTGILAIQFTDIYRYGCEGWG